MSRGTPLTLALWLASFAAKVGHAFLARNAIPLNELPLFLGITFGAQNPALWLWIQAGETAVVQAG